MALGKYGRKEKRPSSCFSSVAVVVFVGFCMLGAWALMSISVVPAQRISSPVASTNAKVNEKINDLHDFEDSQGDLPYKAIKGDDSDEKTSEFDQKAQSLSGTADELGKVPREQSDEGKTGEETNINRRDDEKLTAAGNKDADQKLFEKLDDKDKNWENEKINDGLPGKVEGDAGDSRGGQTKEDVANLNENGQSKKEEKVMDSGLDDTLPNTGKSEILKENKLESADWETHDAEAKKEKFSQAVSNSDDEKKSSQSEDRTTDQKFSVDTKTSRQAEYGEEVSKELQKEQKEQGNGDLGHQYSWKLCNVSSGPDYIPCLDNEMAIRQLRSTAHYEHRERHCPEVPPTCLVPLPEGYKKPITWPTSRAKIWYNNVPHTKLAVVKRAQNWLRVSGKYLTFPGGGTQFKHGALHYIDFVEKALPDISWGKHSRVVLDVGCGVASFGGFLFEKDVLTMSFAPNDEHEAQVQLALERGIPAISAVMGTQRLPFPSVIFDIVHCARCRVPWHADGGRLLLELNRILRPGGYFIWSATPVYKKGQEDVQIWKAMSDLTASMCWNLVAKKNDRVNAVGVAIYQKPTSNSCYDLRRKQDPPMCDETDDPNAAWYIPMKSCLHKVPTSDGERGTVWPEDWPLRLEKPPFWLYNMQAGLYGKQAAIDFTSDTDHWRRVVTKSYLTGFGINWSTVRNVMDMKAVYGGFAAALAGQHVWVMNVVPIDSPDTLPIIYDRGLFGIYHDWCQSFSTYPRTYDLLHADHLFSKLKKRCQLEPVMAEVDRILRPGGSAIFRDKLDIINELETLIKSLHWEVRLTYSKEKEGILCAQKTMWRPASS